MVTRWPASIAMKPYLLQTTPAAGRPRSDTESKWNAGGPTGPQKLKKGIAHYRPQGGDKDRSLCFGTVAR